MNDKEPKKETDPAEKGALYFDVRCGDDRRKAPSAGYVYVSTVGWICRRENFRRSGDDGEV